MKTRNAPIIGAKQRLLAASLLAATCGTAFAQGFTHTQAPIQGTIEKLVIDPSNCPNGDVTHTYCGGLLTVGGQEIILPQNLLIDLPANRLTLQQLIADAPGTCGGQQSGLAANDTCAGAVAGVATVLANHQAFGSSNGGKLIAGELFIEKGQESLAGTVTCVDATNGYALVNGNTVTTGGNCSGVVGLPGSGVMLRINDPSFRHTIQHGPGCGSGSNCSADERFGLDPDNYTITYSTGYPACIPSNDASVVIDGETIVLTGFNPPLCPAANRTDALADFATRFAPLQVRDSIFAEGNYETVGSTTFFSAHTLTIGEALLTGNGQPDYMIFDEVEWDAPGYQNGRVRALFIGFTTRGDANVEIFRLAKAANGDDQPLVIASTAGCEVAEGAGACLNQGVAGAGFGIFKINYDVDFFVGVDDRRSPCLHLNAARSAGVLSDTTGVNCSPSYTLQEDFDMLAPITREVVGRTDLNLANPDAFTVLDIKGGEATWGQYLTPVGVGHPEFVEINLAQLQTPFIFSGQQWLTDRRFGPGGFELGTPTAGTANPFGMASMQLIPFPCSGLSPVTQAPVPDTEQVWRWWNGTEWTRYDVGFVNCSEEGSIDVGGGNEPRSDLPLGTQILIATARCRTARDLRVDGDVVNANGGPILNLPPQGVTITFTALGNPNTTVLPARTTTTVTDALGTTFSLRESIATCPAVPTVVTVRFTKDVDAGISATALLAIRQR